MSSLRFWLLVFAPCVHRARLAPLETTAHAGPTGSCVAVSLWRDVPLPAFFRTLTQLGRTSLRCLPVRQRSWDFFTLRSVPRPRVPAFVTRMSRGPFNCRAGVSAVHPHLPLSTAPRPADFYGCRSRESELLPLGELLESDRLRNESTGSWVLLPRTSRAGRASSDALRPANPAMGF
jgi:hypothetical protein